MNFKIEEKDKCETLVQLLRAAQVNSDTVKLYFSKKGIHNFDY